MNMLSLKKSSRIAVACAVFLVAAAGFKLMTDRIQALDYTAEANNAVYEETHTDIYATYVSSDNNPLEEIFVLPTDIDEENYEAIVVYPGVNFNPYFGPPSRFNRDVPLSWTWSWPEMDALGHHLFALDPSTVEGETVRLLDDFMNDSPMPEGWYLSHIELGGREFHLYHEFETHEIMLNPYTIALEYVAIDAPWNLEAELAMMDQADLLFNHFEELLAVSFRVQKVEREEGMTNYKNAQLTRERTPINDNISWCHEDYVTHSIPFYVYVGTPDDLRVRFLWVPAGFELNEVENIINSLRFEELGLEVESTRITENWLQYGPHVYSIDISFARTQDIEDSADICEELIAILNDKAKYLFDIFGDLMTVIYYFDLSDYSGAGYKVRRADVR